MRRHVLSFFRFLLAIVLILQSSLACRSNYMARAMGEDQGDEDPNCDVWTRIRGLGISPPKGLSDEQMGLRCKRHVKLVVPPEAETLKDSIEPFAPEAFFLDFDTFRAGRSVSVGEGDGDLVSFLLQRGADTYGLDIDSAYENGTLPAMKEFPGRFVFGDATKLSSSSLATQPFDHVFSAMLLCCINHDLARDILIDSVRTLKVGGTSRHLFAGEFLGVNVKSKEFQDMLRAIRDAAAGDGFRLAMHFANVAVFRDKPEPPHAPYLLVLKKEPRT